MNSFRYEGRRQSAISFPLGGIGSGCIGLSGSGRLIDWEIFNRPAKHSCSGFSHFAVRAEDGDRILDARVLCADEQPPYTGGLWGTGDRITDGFGFGADRCTMGGLPHFASCSFEGRYPFAELDFDTGSFPASVRLTAFSPFIPTNEDDSSIPAAFFSYEITNTADKRLGFTLAGTLCSPFSDGESVNRLETDGALHMLRIIDTAHDPGDVRYGDLTLATDAEEVSFQEYWYRGLWFDSLSVYWHDLRTQPRLHNRRFEPDGRAHGDHGTLAAHLSLAPGETRSVRFVISWNIPNRENYWSPTRPDGSRKPGWRNWYATRFRDSADSAGYALRGWNRLYEETRLYQRALFSSSLPEPVLDAISSTVSVLKSPTVLRLEDGSLYGWEGCAPRFGSCEGSCSHVWAYTYAMPYLFPRLERSMRDIEYRYTQDEHGGLHFRVMLPLGSPLWDFRPCADGQFATVFKTWREYCVCGDIGWLREKWPQVRRAVAYAWDSGNPDAWDPDRSGVLTGRQHHTLDMELFGPNSWLSSMYLCALRAAEEMAKALGDADAAREYREIFERGSSRCSDILFNGEYFCQRVDLSDRSVLERFEDGHTLVGGGVVSTYWDEEHGQLKYQVGEGCLIDQVLGQWHADMLGLGDLLDRDRVNSALRSIYRYNFISMRDHVNPCRLYALNDERGTLICSFPEGHERPVIPVPYAEETMHGFEYQAAAHMIARGMREEGLAVASAVRERYDGERRNPWNEMECGSNYARSMASYALLLAYSGMRCDMGRDYLGFNPIDGVGRFFWSLDSGFGQVSFEEDGTVSLEVMYGTLRLRELGLPRPGREATLGGVALESSPTGNGIRFRNGIEIPAGETLVLRMEDAR